MTLFDQLFYNIFQYYKTKYKTKANNIALFYILIFQASILLLLGTFFMLFIKQMNVDSISTSKAWTLYILAIIVFVFRNWIYYTGKKRKIINATFNKSKSYTQNIWLLWLIPFCCFIFAIILLQRW